MQATGRTLTNKYSYDAASNRIAFTNPEAGVTSYTYDSLNRLTALRDFNANAFTFSYDALGRRSGLTRPNLVNTNYTYDALSRLLSVVHQQGLIGAGTSYTYDAVGNRTARTDFVPGSGQIVQSYTYDSIYQLSQAVVSTVPPTTTETYTYDKVGNRLSSLGVPAFTYNSSNQLLSAQIAPLVAANFTYDANGNTLTRSAAGLTTSNSWDFENRLIGVTLPGTGGTVNFKYDPFGRRIQKSAGLAVTNYAYDGDNAIEELNATGAVTAQYTQGLGIDEPLAMYRAGAVNFYHADGLGSISALTDATGIPAAAYVYDSFGNTITVPGSVTNPFRYTAREFDAETGLYYYRARYYDPAIGRFLTEDALRFRAGNDFYPYVSNTPLNFTDPLGLCKIVVYFERLVRTLYLGNHAFIVVSDNTHRYRVPLPDVEVRGGPSGARPESVVVDVGPASQLPDRPSDASSSMEVLNNNCPCADYLRTFTRLANRVNDLAIPYSFFSRNSNAVVTTILDGAGIKYSAPPFWTPGWGINLLGKNAK